MLWLDRLVAELLAPLAVWVFASSLDDFLLDVSFFFLWCRSRFPNNAGNDTRRVPRASGKPESKIAITVPCWREEDVIEEMLDHNLSSIDYRNYDVWIGIYPNDAATRARVVACQERFPQVRYAVCPHDGPTTKADCLNWIYQGIKEHERKSGQRYAVILQHDAEDVIHPDSLRHIDEYSSCFEMIQIPVFPLALPLRELTHGTYCDFFAEFHLKELRLRSAVGGFIPSAGVGTAYRRDALERLEAANGEQLFDRDSLTEDYFVGFQLHSLGASQTLLAVQSPWRHQRWSGPQAFPGVSEQMVATRSYFPRSFGDAVRQRTRWVTGIVLQSWERFGWRAHAAQWYWLWRDRKGLIGHPASAIANAAFLYALARWIFSTQPGAASYLKDFLSLRPVLVELLAASLFLLVWRQIVRGVFAWKVYGWRQGISVPLRAPWANWINLCSTLMALRNFFIARWRGRSLRWVKTPHAYPSQKLRTGQQPRLGEILVSSRQLEFTDLQAALRHRRWNERLGEYLVNSGQLTETELYKALSWQHHLPFQRLEATSIEPGATDRLPAKVASALRAIPFRLDSGNRLWLASPELPPKPARQRIASLDPVTTRFVLITPSNYRDLVQPGINQTLAGVEPV